ncbi:alpha-L-rhamnosidase [Thermocatellispora tengchongensis]|uniref:alpha-L-rhamnosidase n=1 Tax=Thermocatellispora tengchongensis TaxID=1073253 RepID=A0A840P2N5_9ACTN|nr:alpha-L-rhamnosidase [Thermocatellispora tengchongensis]MBB5135544.1 alpha-L-rhamnosidase [Thermocatellispora tengchongensis]
MSEHSPYDLRVDGGDDRFPVTGERPLLSWKLPRTWSGQDGYDLQVRVEGTEQTLHNVTTARHLFVEWPLPPLRSRQRVAWRVRTHLGGRSSAWSPWHAFEAGLLDGDWRARWISPREDGTEFRPAYVLAGGVDLRDDIVQARLYSTALGVYEAFVNGVRVGTAELTPGCTSYADTLYAQAADVTALLHGGRNDLEIVLSDGWYRGSVGTWRKRDCWGTTTAARLQLHVRYADGAEAVAGTDADWTSRRGHIVAADLMNGQTTDFTAQPGRVRPVLVDAVAAPPIDWSPAPPVRRVERLAPRSVTRHGDGVWIVDFGQNASGWVALTDLGPAGTRTVIDHGEHLDPAGDLTTAHLDSQRPGEPPIPFVQRDEVVSSGRPGEVFEPRHTVHGFRYARVRRTGAGLDPAGIVMRVVHTDLRPTATFACSDDDLNRLHEAARWSFRGNAVDIPTDCPTRERLGWTGDYQVFAPTAARLYDIDGFSRKWLRSVRDDQLDDGRVVNSSPDANRLKVRDDPMADAITGSAGWGDAIVLVPWVLYETYGDTAALAENWPAMRRWVEWALATARTARHPSRAERSPEPLTHEEFVWDGSFHWGEWLEPKQRAADGSLVDPVMSDPMAWYAADKGEVGTAYLFRSVRTLAAVAQVLGHDDDAACYRETAEKVRHAWQTEFLDAEGRTKSGTQAGYVRALAFDLVPEELREKAARHLVDLIDAAGGHLGTGFLSTADLLPVLADTGHPDVAYSVLYQRTSPSWLGMLDRGATTIWEDWDGVSEDGTATASLNHYSKGAVIRFLHTHTLGLRQASGSVGWESFLVAPVLNDAITWATGTFDGPQGRIAVEWRVQDDHLTISVDVPGGSEARIRFPDGSTFRTGPGRFSARRPVPGRTTIPGGASARV